jgi:hypothetical protein
MADTSIAVTKRPISPPILRASVGSESLLSSQELQSNVNDSNLAGLSVVDADEWDMNDQVRSWAHP